ncbi:MAG: hypothetical protein WDN49_03985 [Acetobacteraceae bacterium]
MAGIGCHVMALTSTPETRTFSHMGGEGVPWVGMAAFTDTPHMFANMGGRHLPAFRPARDPPGARGQDPDDLQNPLQRTPWR